MKAKPTRSPTPLTDEHIRAGAFKPPWEQMRALEPESWRPTRTLEVPQR